MTGRSTRTGTIAATDLVTAGRSVLVRVDGRTVLLGDAVLVGYHRPDALAVQTVHDRAWRELSGGSNDLLCLRLGERGVVEGDEGQRYLLDRATEELELASSGALVVVWHVAAPGTLVALCDEDGDLLSVCDSLGFFGGDTA